MTRKIYDFSPEQLANLTAIVWLYRGQRQRFLDLVAGYFDRIRDEIALSEDAVLAFEERLVEIKDGFKIFSDGFGAIADIEGVTSKTPPASNEEQHAAKEAFAPFADRTKGLVKQIDLLYKVAARAEQLAQDLARDEPVGANSFAPRSPDHPTDPPTSAHAT